MVIFYCKKFVFIRGKKYFVVIIACKVNYGESLNYIGHEFLEVKKNQNMNHCTLHSKRTESP